MASRTERTYYDVLGVGSDAPVGDVRKAYLERARALHPDRYVDVPEGDRAQAERGMQEVNEAWRVLQDEWLRKEYDRELMPKVDRMRLEVDDERFANRADGTEPDTVDMVDTFDTADGTAKIIRGLPWLVLIGVLFMIFVFTAYAATGGSSTPTPQHNNQCVIIQSGPAGPVTTASDCNAPGARSIASRVSPGQPCPSDTERLQPATDPYAMCLEVR